MKFHTQIALAFIMPAIFVQPAKCGGQNTQNAPSDRTTVTFSDYFTESLVQNPLELEAQGFRIRFMQNKANALSPAYAGTYKCIRVPYGYGAGISGSVFEIERIDGGNISRIDFNIETQHVKDGVPAEIPQSSPAINGDAGDPQTCGELTGLATWEGDCPLVKITLYGFIDKQLFLYFSSFTITSTPVQVVEPMSMLLTVPEIRAVGARTAMMDFSLKVNNDDGIDKFNITAEDAETGKIYCNDTFDRSTFAESISANEEGADNSSYTINGKAKLTDMNKNSVSTVLIKVIADYADGHQSEAAVYGPVDISTVGVTGISDIETDDDTYEYYNMQGMRVPAPTRGIYIRKSRSKTEIVQL